MRRAGWGRIVNVSSEGGSLASMGAGTPAYSTSKAAMNALTRVLAAELRGTGVLVNAVCPGWTATDMGGGGRPVAEGAQSVVWAVTLPEKGPTGGSSATASRCRGDIVGRHGTITTVAAALNASDNVGKVMPTA